MGMTLYATDLDGTLLDNNARLSATTIQGLRRLYQQGALVTFVTARTPATVQPILEQAMPTVPGVVMTGAGIWNPTKRDFEYIQYMEPQMVHAIAEICQRHGLCPFHYAKPDGSNCLQVYHDCSELNPLERNFVDERTINDLKHFNLGMRAPEYADTHTVLFFSMDAPDIIKAAAREIQEKTACYASWYPDTYNPGMSLLEVFAPGVSKANGVKRLQQMLGADRLIAFGDNLNDISLLQVADLAVAVDNAHSELKAVAHKVIGPNFTDSVVKFIENAEKNRTI